ncbi:hypothetical protein H1D32_12765 [Anaerobacillus sp. CMMVII]|uniref:hypothetical protein n=1 Tax=Anaerobacillus sp. CMMVII TaxID=2755588 RepID=UPI0021B8291F|nr:hypothetical protein [Anaerobacillus sp. CMMVII]MCT8138535.1 hypothetical protein [Anaerobacillus sp. CMMVII]
MKKIVSLAIFTFILLIFGVIFFYILDYGKFSNWSYSTTSLEALEEHQTVYIGYGVKWEGLGSPTITDISVIRGMATAGKQPNELLRVTSFIDSGKNGKQNSIGVLDEASVIKGGFLDTFIPVNGYKVNNELFDIVFKLELIDTNYTNDVNGILIEYKHFGISKSQIIDFEGFITDSN